jgi:hypothetical protein
MYIYSQTQTDRKRHRQRYGHRHRHRQRHTHTQTHTHTDTDAQYLHLVAHAATAFIGMVYKMRGARSLAQRDFAAAFAIRDQSLGRRSYV